MNQQCISRTTSTRQVPRLLSRPEKRAVQSSSPIGLRALPDRTPIEQDPTVLVPPCKVDRGDFIQLKVWFCDQFAEVLTAFGKPGAQTIYFCAYDNSGRARFIDWVTEGQAELRYVIKACDVANSAAIAYSATRFERGLYVGRGGPMCWRAPLAFDSEATRRNPEIHPDNIARHATSARRAAR